MSNDDPFTLDLFGNTALSSGLGLGVTAFGSDFGADDVDDDPPPASAGLAVPQAQTAPADRPWIPSGRHVRSSRRELRSRKRPWPSQRLEAAHPGQSGCHPPRRGPSRPLIVRQRVKNRRGSSVSPASGPRNSPMACSGVRAKTAFRAGWEEIGAELEAAVSGQDYASLARCTQYAHFTPEFIVRAIWSGLQRLGWRGGRVLEPGIGTGLFPALMPGASARRDPCHRRRARSRHGTDCSSAAAAGAHHQRRLRPRRPAGSVSTSPSATRRSPIAPSAQIGPIGQWGCACTIISSPGRSIC